MLHWKERTKLCKGGSKSGGGGGGGAATQGEISAINKIGEGTHDDSNIDYFDYAVAAGIKASDARKIFNAITLFTGDGYTGIRAAEMAGKEPKVVKRINQYINNMAPFKGEVYRGLKFNDEAKAKAFLDDVKVGATMTMPAISSFSSRKSIAEDFAGARQSFYHSVVMTVTSNKSGVSIKGKSAFQSEYEVLVRKGTSYKIKSTRYDAATKTTYIEMSER